MIKTSSTIKRKTESQSNIKSSKTTDLIGTITPIWEKCRQKRLKSADRQQLLTELKAHIKSSIYKLSLKRMGSRILQTYLKYCKKEDLEEFYSEIEANMEEIVCSKYGKYVIERLVSKKYTERLLKSLEASYQKILTHRMGIFVFNDIFIKSSNKEKVLKKILGSEVQLFYKNEKLNEIPAEKIKLKGLIDRIISKGLTNCEIVHEMIRLQLKNREDRAEIYRAVRGVLVDFLHTKSGRMIARAVLKRENKQKVLKAMGEFVPKIVEHEDGRRFLIEVIKSEDKEMVRKYLLRPIKRKYKILMEYEELMACVQNEPIFYQYLKNRMEKLNKIEL